MTDPESLPVLGIDPGARWTAGVLRIGDWPATGWTLGPINAQGEPWRNALDDPDDLNALTRYCTRVLDFVGETFDSAKREHGRCRLAIEAIRIPTGWRRGNPGRIAVGDWLTPRSVVVAIRAVYPNAVLVPAVGGTQMPRDRYPLQLQRRRPPEWGPCEAPRGERDHERSAYDVAGIAASAPRKVSTDV